jgi:hypothetical protein
VEDCPGDCRTETETESAGGFSLGEGYAVKTRTVSYRGREPDRDAFEIYNEFVTRLEVSLDLEYHVHVNPRDGATDYIHQRDDGEMVLIGVYAEGLLRWLAEPYLARVLGDGVAMCVGLIRAHAAMITGSPLPPEER